MTIAITGLPRWRPGDHHPAPGTAAFDAVVEDLNGRIREAAALLEPLGATPPPPFDPARCDRAFAALNDIGASLAPLMNWLEAQTEVDADAALERAAHSELEQAALPLAAARRSLERWLAASGDVSSSAAAREHEFYTHKAVVSSAHRMSPAEEDLQDALALSGTNAWARLHTAVTQRLMVACEHEDGSPRTVPMTVARNLARDPVRRVRMAAHRGELQCWEDNATPIAAALNGVKGHELVVSARRRWQRPLDVALHQNNVSSETLAAMQGAVVESFPDFRDYLRAKARLIGVPRAAFFDIFAPVGSVSDEWSWEQAIAYVRDVFTAFTPAKGQMVDRALAEGWFDAGPRPGKTGGAFCTWLGADRSWVMLNFGGTFRDVQTIAHELGHAYHNLHLARCTPLQRDLTMALAETASTFAQNLVIQARLEQASEAERMSMLEDDIQSACQLLVDIHCRFTFETALFEQRRERELSAEELCTLMAEAQGATYGDGLDESELHPYMWAAKPHYYSWSYYNWPYTFGHLFAMGLYARFLAEPSGFSDRYDQLLAGAGLASAEALAAGFGIDTTDIAFWRSAVDPIRRRIRDFNALAASASPAPA
ncbi:MAG: M3 family oligoendopeptidase [Candidatus Dormibacteria bacterium]